MNIVFSDSVGLTEQEWDTLLDKLTRDGVLAQFPRGNLNIAVVDSDTMAELRIIEQKLKDGAPYGEAYYGRKEFAIYTHVAATDAANRGDSYLITEKSGKNPESHSCLVVRRQVAPSTNPCA